MKVRVAAVQTQTKLHDVDFNTRRACEYVEQAAGQGAQFVLLPEGYPGPWKQPFDFSPVPQLAEAAAKHNIYVLAGAFTSVQEQPTKGYAAHVLIGPKGLIGTYNRTTPKGPWRYKMGMKEWDFDYKEADDLPVFETPYGTVGIVICSEIYSPEVARILALKGAEIIFMPTGTAKNTLWATWRNLVWSRAIENLAYTVTCQNVLGTEPGLAMICSPEDILLESTIPGIYTADCDLERIRWIRNEYDNHFAPMPFKTKPGQLRDWHRPEIYGKNLANW